MAREKFLGLQYPLQKTTRGIFAQSSGINQIKADMLILLNTNPGERVMLPEFGVPLKELMFEPNDAILEVRARKMIADAIQMWEPRIVVNDIIVTSKPKKNQVSPFDDQHDMDHILHITIRFTDPENIQSVEELSLEKPLGA